MTSAYFEAGLPAPRGTSRHCEDRAGIRGRKARDDSETQRMITWSCPAYIKVETALNAGLETPYSAYITALLADVPECVDCPWQPRQRANNTEHVHQRRGTWAQGVRRCEDFSCGRRDVYSLRSTAYDHTNVRAVLCGGYQSPSWYNHGIHNSVLHQVGFPGRPSGARSLISNSLALFSSARRIEVFAATSAFAAVQVVYVAVKQ